MRAMYRTVGLAFVLAVGIARGAPPATLPGPSAALAATPAPQTIEPRDVRPHVYFLASPEMRGRGDFRSRAAAAKYIVDEFGKLGLKPLFEQGHWHQDVPGVRDDQGNERIIGRNIGAWMEGSDPKLKDEFIILSAHYDHLGERGGRIHAGADDNAVGVAMMLEVAKQLTADARAGKGPKRSIMFVSFDLEESLLWGSKWFVGHLPRPKKQIKLFMTADLLGRSLGDLPFHRLFVMGAERGTGLKSLVRSVKPAERLGVTQLGVDLVGTVSDYGPFRDDEIPFLFFSTGRHPDYHSPRDTPDKVDYVQLADISNVILALTRKASDGETTPNWIPKPVSDLEEVTSLRDLTKLVLDEDERAQANGGRALQGFHRQLLTSIYQYAERVAKSGEFNEADRGWLRRSTQFLLMTGF